MCVCVTEPISSLLCANISDDDDDIVPNHRVLTHFQLANKHLQLAFLAISKREGGVSRERPM